MVFSLANSIESSHDDFYSKSDDFLIKSFSEPDCVIKKEEAPWIGERVWDVIKAFFSHKEIKPYSLKDNITYLSKLDINTKDLQSAIKIENFLNAVDKIVRKKNNSELTKLMNEIVSKAQNARQKLEDETTNGLLKSSDQGRITSAITSIQSPKNLNLLQQKLDALREAEQFTSLMKAGGQAKDPTTCARIIQDLNKLQKLTPAQSSMRTQMNKKLQALIDLSKL